MVRVTYQVTVKKTFHWHTNATTTKIITIPSFRPLPPLGVRLNLNNVKSVFYKFLWIPSNGIHFSLCVSHPRDRITSKNLFDNIFVREFEISRLAKINPFNSILIFIQAINSYFFTIISVL